jgi:hypothetical protein
VGGDLARDFERLHGAYRRVNTSPAGAAIMVGSELSGESRAHRGAARLRRVHENCADAILELNADDSLEMPAVISILYHSMAKWADDIIQWTHERIRLRRHPGPLLRNVVDHDAEEERDRPAEVKGASAEALGCFVTSYHALKGTTGLPITERYYALDMLWRVADNAVRDSGLVLRPASGARDPQGAHARAVRGGIGRPRPTSPARSCASVISHGGQRTRS